MSPVVRQGACITPEIVKTAYGLKGVIFKNVVIGTGDTFTHGFASSQLCDLWQVT